jgi:hypothetical protein
VFKVAQQNFIGSMAAYSVVCYLLQVVMMMMMMVMMMMLLLLLLMMMPMMCSFFFRSRTGMTATFCSSAMEG